MRNAKVTGILAAATMFIGVDVSRAASFEWDADGNAANLANGGSGNWNTTVTNKVWYDSTTSTDVAWTAGSEAVFGGTAGAITVSGSPNPSKLTINTDGYVFNANLSVTAAASPTDAVIINGNVQFNGGLTPLTNVNITISPSKTLTLAGGGRLNKVTGGSVSVTNTGALQLNIGPMALASSVTQTGGIASALVSGQNPVIGSSATGSWTMNGNNAVINVVASTVGNPVNFDIGANNSGNGTLTINSGAVSVTGSTLRIGVLNGTGVVNVAGGSLAVTGTASGLYLADSGSGNGTLNISSGTATVDAIQFGRTGQTPSGQGRVNLSGGTLYVGSGGISLGTLAATKASISLSGGTLGASADWSSSMTISVSAASTIKAADAADVAHNITLTGNITGNGSITKSGGGKLSLASAGYTGATQVTAGTFEVNGTIASSGVTVSSGASLTGTGTVTNGVTIDGTAAPAGTGTGTLKVGSAAFGLGSTLEINLGTAGQSDVFAVAGALDITNATLNLSGAADNSSYVIATYGGKLTGTFAGLLNLPDNYKIDYGTGTNSAITLAVPEPAMGLLLPGVAMLLGRRRRRKHSVCNLQA